MIRRIVILGKKPMNVAEAQAQLFEIDTYIFTGTGITDLREAFETVQENGDNIDHVFIGAGIELERRLEIVRECFKLNNKTTVHMKGANTGRGSNMGFLPFVKAVLKGFEAEDYQ